MTELSKYVSKVISEIIDGVVEAQLVADKYSAKVVPTGLNLSANSTKDLILRTNDANVVAFIDFEISLIAENVAGGEGGFSVDIFKVGANAKLSGNRGEKNTHKVRFKVPILFPSHDDSVGKNNKDH